MPILGSCTISTTCTRAVPRSVWSYSSLMMYRAQAIRSPHSLPESHCSNNTRSQSPVLSFVKNSLKTCLYCENLEEQTLICEVNPCRYLLRVIYRRCLVNWCSVSNACSEARRVALSLRPKAFLITVTSSLDSNLEWVVTYMYRMKSVNA